MLKRTGLSLVLLLASACDAPTEAVLTRVMNLQVASARVPCESIDRSTCLQIRTSSTEAWTPFHQDIEGFAFEPGFEYALEVAVYRLSRAENGSAERYELRQIVSRVAVPPA